MLQTASLGMFHAAKEPSLPQVFPTKNIFRSGNVRERKPAMLCPLEYLVPVVPHQPRQHQRVQLIGVFSPARAVAVSLLRKLSDTHQLRHLRPLVVRPRNHSDIPILARIRPPRRAPVPAIARAPEVAPRIAVLAQRILQDGRKIL